MTLLAGATANAVLTSLKLSWPAANGKLTQIKFDNDVVYETDISGTSVTLTAAQLAAASTTAKRTIAKGTSDVLTLVFENNVNKDMALYTGTAGFDEKCEVTILP